jgi:hypothetical protein
MLHVDAAMRTHADEEPALAPGDGTSRGVEAVRSDPSVAVMRQESGAARRRRQAILASVVSLAVALALLAYSLEQQGSQTSLSQDIVGNQTKGPAPPRTAVDSMRQGVGSVVPESSVQASTPAPSPDLARRARAVESAVVMAPRGGQTARGSVADEAPGAAAAAAAPEQTVSSGSDATATPTTPCSGPALALGLCDADSASKGR